MHPSLTSTATDADGFAPQALSPRFMARFGGLPFDAVTGLGQPASVAWAEQVSDFRTELAEEGRALSDALALLVQSNEDTALRRMLLNTRRQIFAGGWPKDGRRTAALVGGPTGAALDRWLDRHEQLTALLAQPVVEEELARAREHLRALAGEPRLRQGLILASPTLDAHLKAYLDAPPAAGGTAGITGGLTKKQRRIERSLLEYVYRCACKTSPFSSFTGVTVGEFDALSHEGAEDRPALVIDERWTGRARLNVAVLARLGELVAQAPHLRPDLPVELVTGVTAEAGRVRYVRRKVSEGDDSASVSFDAVTENMFFLRQGQGLDALITLCDAEGRLPYGELLDRFARHVRVDRDDCDRFLATLLRLGLLSVPALAVDLHSPDPVSAFADGVRSMGREWSGRLAAGLDEVAGLVREYGHAPLDRRRALLTEVRDRLARVQEELGLPAGSLPWTLVYEDTRATAAPVRLDGKRFAREVGTALSSLARIMPAFDVALPHRATLRGFFLARYGTGGRCDDLLELVTDFQEDLYGYYVQVAGIGAHFEADGTFVPTENWLGQPEITAADEARQAFARRMRAVLDAAGGPDRPDEVEIDDDFIDGVARSLGGRPGDFRPQAHFLQLCGGTERPTAVLNRSWGGVSFPFSRFTHDFDDLGLAEQLRRWHREIQPEGAVLAEITGGATRTNLNLHGRLTDYEIVCPGEASTAPAESRITLADLSLHHDPETDRLVLRSARLGREVVPVYFGYLVPAALPEVARTLLLLAPSSIVTIDPWGGVPQDTGADGVAYRPRVRHRGVVLSRRSWTAAAQTLPRHRPETDTGAWFAQWQEWRRRHGLPARVFVTLRPDGAAEEAPEAGADGSAAADRPARRHKPHFLDFGSALSLQLFEHLLREAGTGSVVFTEMLPAPDHLHTTSDEGAHITELVVETVPGRRPSHSDRREPA